MLYIKTKKLTKKSRTYAACRGFFLYSTVKHPGMEAVIMPVPRNLSSSCGTCVRFACGEETLPEITEELEQIAEILEEGYRTVYRAEE